MIEIDDRTLKQIDEALADYQPDPELDAIIQRMREKVADSERLHDGDMEIRIY
jgi:hypothetical protein